MVGNQLSSGSSVGFFGRLKNSFFGVFIGLLFVPASLALLSWNEYRTVHRSRGLAEAALVIQTIPDIQQSAPQLNDSLVHLSGIALADGEISDADLKVLSKGLRLQRQVEYYHWHEKTEPKQDNSDRKMRHGTNQRQETRYEKRWTRQPIDSSKFKQSAQHWNPTPRFREQTYNAPNILLGVYELSDSLKSSIANWTDVQIDLDTILLELPEDQWEHFSSEGNQLYYSTSGGSVDSPHIGDLRISFAECLATEVSIAAKLSGTQLGNFRTSNGESIERLFMGTLSAADLMDRLVAENTVIAWALRTGGAFLCLIGFTLILGPISTMTRFIPIVGRLTSGLVFLVSLLLAVVLCSLTIAIAWISVRPLFGISLMVIAGIGVFLLFRLRTSNTDANDQPAASVT